MVWGYFHLPEDVAQAAAASQERIETFSNAEDGLISQDLADAWALVAQKYAGYFYGHPTRAGQYGKPDAGKVYVDYDQPWEEPVVFPDDCEFCQRLTPDSVESRIRGFQESINIEVKYKPEDGLPMVDLPFYLKQRLCVEWNHLLRDYLVERPFLFYDFEERQLKTRVTTDERTTASESPA